jgi:hypothetical protein
MCPLTPFIYIHNVNVRTCVHMDVVVFTYVSINVLVYYVKREQG